MNTKPKKHLFKINQLDAHHIRIELFEDKNQIVAAVLFVPLGELHIPYDLNRILLKEIREYIEKQFCKISTIVKC